jgi:hypothetical protein
MKRLWKRFLTVTSVATATALAAVGFAHAEPLATGGIWTAYGDVASATKSCGVQASLNAGIFRLSIASDQPNILHLELSKQAWAIPHKAVPIIFTFPDGTSFHLVGIGQGADMNFNVPNADIKSFLHQFTAEDTGSVSFPEGREMPWTLQLAGTTPTVTAMAKCAEDGGIVLPPPFTQQPIQMLSAGQPSADTQSAPPSSVSSGNGGGSAINDSDNSGPANGGAQPAIAPAVQGLSPPQHIEPSQGLTKSSVEPPETSNTSTPGDASPASVAIVLVLGIAALIVFIGIYLLPTAVGKSRKVQNAGLLFAVNLMFGWTLIGWFGCLLWAALAQDETQRLLYQHMLAKQIESG